MLIILITGLAAFLLCFLIFYYKDHLSNDHLRGPQKIHVKPTPRIGGIALFMSLVGVFLMEEYFGPFSSAQLLPYLIISAPVFLIGLIEDFTQKVGVRTRLLVAFVSGACFIWFSQAAITSVDIPFVDRFLDIFWISCIFTCFAIAGLSNAYNIVDGLHGLSSMVGIITLGAIAYIAWQIEDLVILHLSLAMIGAILGFFVWNYPRGYIFLGDSGAYLIGYWIAILSISLVYQHKEVSPWFALVVNAYPVTETLFTIWRRKVTNRVNVGAPDAQHLHSLIYLKKMQLSTLDSSSQNKHSQKNAAASTHLWLISFCSVLPAIFFGIPHCG
jgi:UDP-N-acetylmuramyl pentapeptide phosphotransferase/UDP-N-acetylglucosamine-1-phosphate transferase